MIRDAEISPCGRFRYRLTRRTGDGPLLPFIMLNPSTADATVDDPTIRRCLAFAAREGYSGIVVGNVFGFRSPKPSAIRGEFDPFGEGNLDARFRIAREAKDSGAPIVCGWGSGFSSWPAVERAVDDLKATGARLVCLGTTKDGSPRHPLYVRGDQPLVDFTFKKLPPKRRKKP